MKIPYVFRKCSKCGRWLVASSVNFSKMKTGKYGLRNECKECVRVSAKKYYEENKEGIVEQTKKYQEENKEKIAKQKKKYYKENKEKFAEYSKKYQQEHREEIAEQQKKYQREHREERAEYMKKYYRTPQGQVVEINKRSRRRQRKDQQGNGITGQQWLEMMKFFGFKCAYSGKSISIKKNRSIDHIVPLVKGGAHEIWNCVPMDRSLNSSKHDKDLEEWYPQQDFYNKDRVDKINEWREYAYNKWGNDEIQQTI